MIKQALQNIQIPRQILEQSTHALPNLVRRMSSSSSHQPKKQLVMKAAIFDLDGTLVDSFGDIADAANHAMTTLGYRTYSVQEYKTIAGGGNTKLMTRALRIQMNDEPDADLVEQGVQLKIKYENDLKEHSHTKPFPGIAEMLRGLQGAGIQLAVLSNKTEAHVRSTVKICFPDIDWSYVAGARADMPLKPDPSVAIRIVKEHMLGVEPADCVFVGDTEYDMITGKAAGMTSLGVPWGCRKSDELIASGAAKIVADAGEITDFVITESS